MDCRTPIICLIELEKVDLLGVAVLEFAGNLSPSSLRIHRQGSEVSDLVSERFYESERDDEHHNESDSRQNQKTTN